MCQESKSNDELHLTVPAAGVQVEMRAVDNRIFGHDVMGNSKLTMWRGKNDIVGTSGLNYLPIGSNQTMIFHTKLCPKQNDASPKTLSWILCGDRQTVPRDGMCL